MVWKWSFIDCCDWTYLKIIIWDLFLVKIPHLESLTSRLRLCRENLLLQRLVCEAHHWSISVDDALATKSTTVLTSLLSQRNIASTRSKDFILSLLPLVERCVVVSELLLMWEWVSPKGRKSGENYIAPLLTLPLTLAKSSICAGNAICYRCKNLR
jgi:hypothetical protein